MQALKCASYFFHSLDRDIDEESNPMTQPSMPQHNKTRPVAHELFPGLTVRLSADVDTISWINRHIPKHQTLYITYILSLIVATGLGSFLSIRLYDDLSRQSEVITLTTSEVVISLFFVSLSWIGVIAIVYYLLRLSWHETIQISDTKLCLRYDGLLSPKEKCIPADRIWCLSFEKVGNERDQETRFTLNLFDIDDKRVTLAYWIRAEENYQLFLLLEKIFAQRQWLVQSRSTFKKK